eukprot:1125773-Prorocentrum_minimum.AAC.2
MPTLIICTLPRLHCLSIHPPCARTPRRLLYSSERDTPLNPKPLKPLGFWAPGNIASELLPFSLGRRALTRIENTLVSLECAATS